MAVWNKAREEQMISMIQERPALYDVTQNLYASRRLRAQLWNEIENKLVISEKHLKKRWESLRKQYKRYKKLPSGSLGAPKTSRQQLILSRLQFLEPRTTRQESTFTINDMEPLDTDDASLLSTGTHEEPDLFESELKPHIPLAESTICEEGSPVIKEEPLLYIITQLSPPRPRVKHSRKTVDESVSDESANLLRTVGKTLESFPSQEDGDDQISAYCRSMAQRMRTLPPHLLPHFMHDVDNSIFKYQVLFSRPSCSENPTNILASEIHPLQPTATYGNL